MVPIFRSVRAAGGLSSARCGGSSSRSSSGSSYRPTPMRPPRRDGPAARHAQARGRDGATRRACRGGARRRRRRGRPHERLQRPADPPRHRRARGRASRCARSRRGCAPTRASRRVAAERRARAALPAQRPRARRRRRPRSDTAPGTTVEWWAARSGFPQAWDISQGAGATVAVIDTGAEIGHPELVGRVAGLATRSTPRARPRASTRSATARTSRRSRARRATTASGSPARARLPALGRSSPTSATRASRASIVWAVDHRADAINMSFGTAPGATPSLPVRNAIDYAIAHGVVLVAAAADDPIEDRATRRAPAADGHRAGPERRAGPVGHGRGLPRPPCAVRGPRHADLARRVRHVRGQRQQRPAGHLRRVHVGAERARHRHARPGPPVPVPHGVPRPTPGTPTCRAPRWRRRWSRPPRRSSATSTRTCRRPRSSASSSRPRAARPGRLDARPRLGDPRRGRRARARPDDRPPAAVLEDPPDGPAHAPHAADPALARRATSRARACFESGLRASSCGARSTGASRASC